MRHGTLDHTSIAGSGAGSLSTASPSVCRCRRRRRRRHCRRRSRERRQARRESRASDRGASDRRPSDERAARQTRVPSVLPRHHNRASSACRRAPQPRFPIVRRGRQGTAIGQDRRHTTQLALSRTDGPPLLSGGGAPGRDPPPPSRKPNLASVRARANATRPQLHINIYRSCRLTAPAGTRSRSARE